MRYWIFLKELGLLESSNYVCLSFTLRENPGLMTAEKRVKLQPEYIQKNPRPEIYLFIISNATDFWDNFKISGGLT